jgi:hypothetical protein
MNSLAYMFDTEKSFELLKDEHIILSYQGALDGELIDMLIQLTDKMLLKQNTRLRFKKKIINILVECLQNSFHYTTQLSENEDDAKIAKSPFLILSKQDEVCTVFTGNYVSNERAAILKEKVANVCDLDDEELQQYYIKSLNKDELPQSGGAGLGLVDIIRRAKHHVVFDFKEINESYQLFSILVKIHFLKETPDSNEY